MAIGIGKHGRTAGRVTMGQVVRVEVVEYTDVMCSWAWGSESKLWLLRWRSEDRCAWRLVIGGLVGDRSKNPAWAPVGPVPKTIAFWAQVAAHTGAPYPVHLNWCPLAAYIEAMEKVVPGSTSTTHPNLTPDET